MQVPYQATVEAWVLHIRTMSPGVHPELASAIGFITGKGPALCVELTDGRHFVASTKDAETAVAVVNAHLDRLARAQPTQEKM